MSGKMKSILVIDDEIQWLKTAMDLLKDDYHVFGAITVSEALRVLDTHDEIVLVLTDLVLTLPEDSQLRADAGINLIEIIHRKRPQIPIIVYSAYLHEFKDELVELGVQSVISKRDTKSDDLRKTIRRAIEEYEVLKTKTEMQRIQIKDIKAALAEEINKYSSLKEHTISIPGERNYELIKPLIGFRRDIEKRIVEFPFRQNVFLMMKFRASNLELAEFIIENLKKNGMRGIRADLDEWNITKNVYNPISVLYCCKYGIVLFDEPEEHQAYSPNVAYELGMMHYQNKDCLILKHESLPRMPFDLIKDIYVPYKKDLQVRKIIETWVKQISLN